MFLLLNPGSTCKKIFTGSHGPIRKELIYDGDCRIFGTSAPQNQGRHSLYCLLFERITAIV